LVDPESGTPANGVRFAIPANEVQFIADIGRATVTAMTCSTTDGPART
jgi:hypothetical protein